MERRAVPPVRRAVSVVEGLLASQAADWATGDIDGVLADYWDVWDTALYLDGLTHRGTGDLAGFHAGMRLELTGEPLISLRGGGHPGHRPGFRRLHRRVLRPLGP